MTLHIEGTLNVEEDARGVRLVAGPRGELELTRRKEPVRRNTRKPGVA
jgi:hypothetical protein